MRLWHYQIIPVLPKDMLVSQWRECIAIKRQWEKGTLKHRLVSYVKNYEPECFVSYVYLVAKEMVKRNIKYQSKYYDEIENMCTYGRLTIFDVSDYQKYKEHNKRYLLQNYYNLQEKYDRGIISKKEWKKIEDFYNNIFLKEVD